MARPQLTPSRAVTVVIAVVSLVLVAVIGVGSWLAWGRFLPLEEAVGAPPLGEAGRQPSDPLALAELGGAKENYTQVRSLAGVAALRMLTRDELAAFAEFGAGRVRLAVSKFDGGSGKAGKAGKAMVLVVKMPDERSAKLVADRLVGLQRGYGFRPADGAPPGVEAGVVDDRLAAVPGGRAHYTHGEIVVRVEYRGRNPAAAEQGFFTALRAQIRVVSPDG